jgi:hypothetical protein
MWCSANRRFLVEPVNVSKQLTLWPNAHGLNGHRRLKVQPQQQEKQCSKGCPFCTVIPKVLPRTVQQISKVIMAKSALVEVGVGEGGSDSCSCWQEPYSTPLRILKQKYHPCPPTYKTAIALHCLLHLGQPIACAVLTVVTNSSACGSF